MLQLPEFTGATKVSYSDFTLDKVRKTFGLTISDKIDIFVCVDLLHCLLAARTFTNSGKLDPLFFWE